MCQARHLVSKSSRRRNGDDKPLLAADAVWALMSIDGEHNTTESCRDIEHPSWQRVAVFDLNLCGAAEGSARDAKAKPPRDSNPASPAAAAAAAAASAASSSSRNSSATFERPSAVAAASAAARKNKAAPAAAAAVKRPSSSSLNPFAVPETETQSLNPFASNFVPPATTPQPPPPSSASPKSKSSAYPPATAVAPVLRASLVLHLRVLHGRLRSKEVLGDVAVDLVPLLRSGGDRLATDRLEWLEEEAPLLLRGDGNAGVITTPPLVAVDTWVSLRQGTAELRVQILIKPPREHPGSKVGGQRAQGMSALLH